MSKVRLLQAYLTERLTVLVKEILDVVEDTVTEYREETARTQRENESLRRQLRDILLLEAETEWLRSTRSTLGFVAPQQSDDPDRRPCSENSDTTLSQPKPPPVSKPTVEPVISVQLLSIQSDAPPGPLNLPEDQKPLEPWDPATKADPPHQTLDKSSPLPSHSSTSLPKIHVEVPVVVQEESGAPATIKTEPQEFHLSDPEGVTDSVAPPVVEPCFRSRTEPAHLPVQHQNSSQTAPEEDRPAPPNPGLTPELVHRCPRCGEAFGHAAGLLKHLEQKRKTYACEWCCKSFAQSADLRRHLRTHTGERPHRCTFCPKSFSQRGNLRRHLRIHTGERPYSCPLCCRCFSDGDTMKKHKRTHSGERPYRCSRCSKTFTSTSGLHIHLIKNLCFMANSERAVQTSLTNNSANQRPPH